MSKFSCLTSSNNCSIYPPFYPTVCLSAFPSVHLSYSCVSNCLSVLSFPLSLIRFRSFVGKAVRRPSVVVERLPQSFMKSTGIFWVRGRGRGRGREREGEGGGWTPYCFISLLFSIIKKYVREKYWHNTCVLILNVQVTLLIFSSCMNAKEKESPRKMVSQRGWWHLCLR